MPKINHVARCRVSPGHCSRCEKKIPKGAAYRWVKGRYGPKKIRCLLPGCRFRMSDLTSSDKLSQLYQARETVEDLLDTDFSEAEPIKTALEEAAAEAREVADMYRESADNIESGFNARTSVCDELEEKAGLCEEWADALEGVEVNDPGKEEELTDWREEIRSEASDVLNSLEL